MPPSPYTMTSKDIYRYAAEVMQTHLTWTNRGPKCTVSRLLQALFYAAAQLCSVYAACHRLRDAPSDQAVRDALCSLCPEADALEHQLNQSLSGQLPKGLKKRRWRLAIDLNLRPYHGQPHREDKEVYRGEAKSGTTHFHAYATYYLIHRGCRYTLALVRVEKGTAMVTVVKQLLRLAAQTGIRPSLLLLDRGFYSVDVIRYLQHARYPFVMPVVMRGRKPSHPQGASGTRVFAARKRSGWARYTLTNAERRKATVNIAIHCCNWQGRRRRHGRQTLVYAVWGVRPKTTHWLYQVYRQRFGIESSYRQLNQACSKITTRNPVLRLLFVGIALLLRNLWVWLHWSCLASPRRGARRLHLEKLRFQTLLMWLTHVAEDSLGIDDTVLAERVP